MSNASMDRWAAPDLSGESKQFAFLNSHEQEAKVREIFESARQQGYQEGFAEGLQTARINTGAALDALQTYQAQLEAPLDHVDETVLKAMIGLAVKLAEKIVRAEIKIEPALMKAQLHEAIGALSNSRMDITARMNPDDARTISDLIEQGIDFGALNIIADPAIERGDCTLITSTNMVESKVKDRIDQIVQQLTVLIEQVSSND